MEREHDIFVDAPVVLGELTELETNFYNFWKEYRTFNGWALTLNDEEFQELMVDFTFIKGKTNENPPKYGVLEYIAEGKTSFSSDDFTEDLQMKGDHLKKISLTKMGYAEYTPGKEDKDWEFLITEAGAIKAEEIEQKGL